MGAWNVSSQVSIMSLLASKGRMTTVKKVIKSLARKHDLVPNCICDQDLVLQAALHTLWCEIFNLHYVERPEGRL